MNSRIRLLASLLLYPLLLPQWTWAQQPAPGPASQTEASPQTAPPAQNAPLGSQPPPFTAPNPPTPAPAQAPGQRAVPSQQRPDATPDAPLPQPDKSTVDLRDLAPLAAQSAAPERPSAAIDQAADTKAYPRIESPALYSARRFNPLGVYHAPHVPALPTASPLSLGNLVRDGKLYLSLHDAIALALANNLDIEVSRYDLLLADTDLTRAQGGGSLRGIDYTVVQTAPGLGSSSSPLLITATTTGSASPTSVNVTDLSQLTQIGASTQQSLSENSTQTFSLGPAIPLFDPVVTAEAAYFRRSDQNSLISTTDTTGSSTSTSSTGPVNYVSAGIDYQQGFSTGAQLEAYADNAAQVLYAANSQYDPLYSPSTSVTLTQPLLRGRGREVNLRFIRIARLDRKVSRLVFEQQLLETIYGVSRLYYDLVSLGENIGVKQESLAAAQKLLEDDRSQVEEGTLAPIELTRAQALVSSSRLDLIQAQGEYRQEEVILREQLLRLLDGPAASFATIVPTDPIVVPDEQPTLDVAALTQDALASRPDLAQAAIQVQADTISASAARNNVKPQLNLYANVQTRGSSLVPYSTLGTTGTGIATPSPVLTQGGLRLSTIYQGGLQLNMPLRNRIAQADAARDTIQLRQAEGRTAKLANDIRQQIESSTIALESAHQAYAAAVESRNYQQQLLQAEIDKFSVGESTNFLIVQDEAYLAQARSTEVAARSDWMKARLALDRSLGDLLEKNNVQFDEVVDGKTH
jgi:outer membrane protein